MNNQLFNAKVNIITKSEIRYEGILHSINPQQQNLTLKDVRSFGTEGRRPGNEIPPVSQGFDLIVFRAHEINSLKVVQPPDQAASEQPSTQATSQQAESPYQEINEDNTNSNRSQPRANTSRAFDFDEMLEKINDLEKLKSQPQPSQQQKPKYQKSNFFDDLSSTVSERQMGPRTMTREERYNCIHQINNRKHQNDQDTETFGQFYKHNNNNRRGGNRRPPGNQNQRDNDSNSYLRNRYNQPRYNKHERERVVFVEKKTDKRENTEQQ